VKVLAIAPVFDEVTEYSLRWYERLRDVIKGKVELRELIGEKATRSNFLAELKAFNPNIIVFYDHGHEDCLVAQEATHCILDRWNVDKVAGKTIYTMACLSAKKLGIRAWLRGCVYVGYDKPFAFTLYGEKLYSQAANSGLIAYLEGETDWKKVKQIMLKTFQEMMETAIDPWDKLLLFHDMLALRIYDAEPPEPVCPLRKIAISLLGSKLGWKIPTIPF